MKTTDDKSYNTIQQTKRKNINREKTIKTSLNSIQIRLITLQDTHKD